MSSQGKATKEYPDERDTLDVHYSYRPDGGHAWKAGRRVTVAGAEKLALQQFDDPSTQYACIVDAVWVERACLSSPLGIEHLVRDGIEHLVRDGLVNRGRTWVRGADGEPIEVKP